MKVAEYADLFDLLCKGAVRRCELEGSNEALDGPTDLLMKLRDALPPEESAKLLEAIFRRSMLDDRVESGQLRVAVMVGAVGA